MGARLRLEPGRLRRSGDSLISDGENSLDRWLPYQEDSLMLK